MADPLKQLGMGNNIGVLEVCSIIQKLQQSFNAVLSCVKEPSRMEVYPERCSIAIVMLLKVGHKQVIDLLLILRVRATVKHSTADAIFL